ncbi:CCCH zinc finger protein [Viridothelium virens]|uniref:CCCH zinc finger protein n=1 Tax=Viridothelium virens TaxID=1048519 RepID=A0A6A6GUI2_VIRVR|nr:CCCH zinc finger protein [Viridothelium virens]
MAEDEELKAKIATLRERIKMRKQTERYTNSPENPQIRGGASQWVPHRGTPYGITRARGGRYQALHRNRTLVINNPGPPPTPSIAEPASDRTEPISEAGDTPGWVTKRDRHNQLINTAVFEQKTQERMQAISETIQKKQIERNARQKKKLMKHFAAEHALTQSAVFNHEIEVNNIRFRISSDGSKLHRMDGNPNTARSTPKQTRIGGVLFLRSKNGNLYRSGLVKKNPEERIKKRADLCARFTSTGYCPHGPECLYTHDPHKVAICKDFLQKGSCQAGDACDLSHDPNPHRVPACVHFLRGKCFNDECRYAHVHVNAGAPVCRAFATLGYCEAGTSCPDRHVHECPDYTNKGICRNLKCPLPHVDRAGKLRKTTAAQADGEDDGTSDFSSDEEYDQIDNDDVDSDDLEDEVIMTGQGGGPEHEISHQHDFVRF